MLICDRLCTMHLFSVTSANIEIHNTSLKTRFFRLHFCTESVGVCSTTIIIIIHEFHRDASLQQNIRAAMCHVLHYSCNVNAAVADRLHCRMICRTDYVSNIMYLQSLLCNVPESYRIHKLEYTSSKQQQK